MTTRASSAQDLRLRDGVRDASIFAASVLPYGIAFGVLADQTGLPLLSAVAMSVLINSGSAQFVALQVWSEPLLLSPLLFAAFAMNARYILFSATLRPYLADAPWRHAYGVLFFLADANWALLTRKQPSGLAVRYLLGCGAIMFAAWVSGTAIGALLGRAIASPHALGLDFMLLAFFATMLVGQWRGRCDAAPLLVAAAAALAIDALSDGGWGLLAGGLIGSIVGAFTHGPTDDTGA